MLEAYELTKKYGAHNALNNLSLIINKEEVFCLLGQNGAGKTTAINIFLGFTSATSGSAKINGIEVKPNDTSTKKFIAYIAEVVMLYGNLNAIENLDFFSRLAGYKYTKDLLKKFLTQAGLQAEAYEKRLLTYSKGMRQKVGIAIALAKNADAILMDEPTSGLDPKATQEFTEVVLGLAKQGKAILMATHDIFNAVNVGTRIGIMKQGQLVHTMNASDISAIDLQQLYLKTI